MNNSRPVLADEFNAYSAVTDGWIRDMILRLHSQEKRIIALEKRVTDLEARGI